VHSLRQGRRRQPKADCGAYQPPDILPSRQAKPFTLWGISYFVVRASQSRENINIASISSPRSDLRCGARGIGRKARPELIPAITFKMSIMAFDRRVPLKSQILLI
jgi:hypothetical protein